MKAPTARHIPAELVPERTLFVLVDAQKAFVDPNGDFAKVWGSDELLSMQESLVNAQAFRETLPPEVQRVFVRSEYEPGQFTDGGIPELCLPGSPLLEWADEISPPGEEDTVITKRKNDLMSAPEFVELIAMTKRTDVRHVLMAGNTITHCIQTGSISIQKQGLQVVVPNDIVGARLSAYEWTDEEALSRVNVARQAMQDAGVINLLTRNHILWITSEEADALEKVQEQVSAVMRLAIDDRNDRAYYKMDEFTKRLQSKYPDVSYCRLYHVLVGSSLSERITIEFLDYEGEDSIVTFMNQLHDEYVGEKKDD